MGYSDNLMIGRKFGRLFVVKRAGSLKMKGLSRKTWLCKCDCGNTKIIDTKSLTSGNTRSCGCLLHDENVKKHIDETIREEHQHLRAVWKNIKNRCYKSNNPEYHRYGGRGIKMCDEWFYSSKSFINWCLNNGYILGLTIDRINNDGNYEPSNCQFVTLSENVLKEKKHITIAGVTLRHSELSEILGFKRKYVNARIRKVGYEKAVYGFFHILVFNL